MWMLGIALWVTLPKGALSVSAKGIRGRLAGISKRRKPAGMGAAEYEDRWSDGMAAWYEQLHPTYTYFEAAGRDVSVTDKVLCLLSEDTDPIEEYVVRGCRVEREG